MFNIQTALDSFVLYIYSIFKTHYIIVKKYTKYRIKTKLSVNSNNYLDLGP